jgi:predicted small secreted protein
MKDIWRFIKNVDRERFDTEIIQETGRSIVIEKSVSISNNRSQLVYQLFITMFTTDQLQAFKAKIDSAQTIALFGHANIDGDAIGSVL